MNKKSYVYKITCKITGEFYFGSSFNAKRDSYWGKGRKIKEQIAQYGKENFIKEILGEFDDRVEAHKVENEYIDKFRNDDKCLNQMLNRRFGSFSEETCAKLSADKRGEKAPWYGKHLSEEVKAKMSAARRGKHHTEETRAKISAGNRGKIVSDDTRARIGAANIVKFSGKHWRKNPITGKREWYD